MKVGDIEITKRSKCSSTCRKEWLEHLPAFTRLFFFEKWVTRTISLKNFPYNNIMVVLCSLLSITKIRPLLNARNFLRLSDSLRMAIKNPLKSQVQALSILLVFLPKRLTEIHRSWYTGCLYRDTILTPYWILLRSASENTAVSNWCKLLAPNFALKEINYTLQKDRNSHRHLYHALIAQGQIPHQKIIAVFFWNVIPYSLSFLNSFGALTTLKRHILLTWKSMVTRSFASWKY